MLLSNWITLACFIASFAVVGGWLLALGVAVVRCVRDGSEQTQSRAAKKFAA